MLNFVGGLGFAAVFTAFFGKTDIFGSLVFGSSLVVLLLGTWFKALAFLAGGIWFGIWNQIDVARSCDQFYWFLCQSPVAAEPAYRFLLSSWFGEPLSLAQNWLARSTAAWDPVWGAWALGLVGGQLDGSQGDLIELYKNLGLLHVLVISGSHFAFLGRLGISVLGLPTRLLYIGRILDFRAWFATHLFQLFLLWVCLGFYGFMVGFPPPCQRAFIIGILTSWWPLIIGRTRPETIWRVASFLQALFFPLSFISLSNALSWSASAILGRFPVSKTGLSSFFLRELAIATMSLAYFGGFSPIALLLNPLLEPIWNSVLLLALLGIGGGGEYVNQTLTLLHRTLANFENIQESLWASSTLGWSRGLEHLARSLSWALTLSWLFGGRRSGRH